MKNIVSLILFLVLLLFWTNHVFCVEPLLKTSGGAPGIVDTKPVDISFDTATIKIALGIDIYSVDATFEYFNHGKTVTTTLGIPKFGYGYYNDFKGVSDFNSIDLWINDDKSELRDTSGTIKIPLGMVDNESEVISRLREGKSIDPSIKLEETRWLTTTAKFESNQRTVIKLNYTAPYGNYGELEFLYGTGSLFKNNISEVKFIIKSSSDVWIYRVHCIKDRMGSFRPYYLQRGDEFKYEYKLTNFKPEQTETFRVIVSTFVNPWEDDVNEQYTNWRYSKQIIPDEMLETLSYWQLRVLRNTFFAIHGRRFQSPELMEYFKKFKWYSPLPETAEVTLNPEEEENVNKIYRYENSFK